MAQILNLFYEEPNPDRWFKYDRYPRNIIRKIIRGKAKPGGVMMIALELMRGLDILGIPYRFNDYKYAKKHPEELIGVIGKPHLIFEKRFKNPILFGAGVFSHPLDALNLFEMYPNVKKILVPGEWMRQMFQPYYGNKVEKWPVGIDTNKWAPFKEGNKEFDFLIYDKIFHDKTLFEPLLEILKKNSLSYHFIKYGYYSHSELNHKLAISKAVIFLCENETQGLAYQQILSTNTPILAWDKEEYWRDPNYYPDRVKFKPVSSVPYWDNRCGIKFKTIQDFEKQLAIFNKGLISYEFSPRDYILENLSLEICAKKYVEIYNSLVP